MEGHENPWEDARRARQQDNPSRKMAAQDESGRLCAFGGTSRAAVVLDAITGAQVFRVPFASTVWAVQLSLMPEGPKLIVGGDGGGKGEWSPRTELIRLLALPPPPRIEVEEIPVVWLSVPLAPADDS